MAEPKRRGDVWTALVYDYTDESGKKKYRRISASTKADWYEAYAAFCREKELSEAEREEKRRQGLTVAEAVDKYIAMCGNLDESTQSFYRQVRECAFKDLMLMPVKELTDEVIQEEIDKESRRPRLRGTNKSISPKTVHNEWGLVSTSLRVICKQTFSVKLPKLTMTIEDLPEAKDVIDLVRGSSVELPCMLAIWFSFSLSEIRGLKCSSIRKGKMFIDQTLVHVDGLDVEKPRGKVSTRTRGHSIPSYIMELIKVQPSYGHYLKTGEDSYLIPLTTYQICGRFSRLMKKGGININFHKLRHISASIMAELNIPTKYAQERGGWKTDYTMKKVYQHTFTSGRDAADAMVDAYMENLLK